MKLKIEHLKKSFNGKKVLKDINIDVQDFHSLAIIGPSGGGKSTLLRILAGLQKPEEGSIYVNGKNIEYQEKALREYRKAIGVVFQSYNLFPHLTALENIVLPLSEIHGVKRDLATKTAMELLERFQLSEHANKKPSQLSGGQQQRVAIARALSYEAQFLLFDEPTSALDPELTNEVLDMIKELKDQQKDLILVTHEMGFARQSCDYVLFVANGEIWEHGPSDQIFEHPRSKELKRFLDKILEWR